LVLCACGAGDSVAGGVRGDGGVGQRRRGALRPDGGVGQRRSGTEVQMAVRDRGGGVRCVQRALFVLLNSELIGTQSPSLRPCVLKDPWAKETELIEARAK
jgi:hypothetical protein